MEAKINKKGLTIAELLIAASITILVVGTVFALWFMTQDTWINERKKSDILQNLQIYIERIKREVQMSDGARVFFHLSGGSSYDAISFPLALDDGRSDTGYSGSQDGDGFIERDSTTTNPVTGLSRIFWDKTVIYHIYNNGTEDELRRTTFYPRNNNLTAAQRQTQIDNVVSLGTGDDATVPNYSNWENTRAIFKASSVSLEVVPRLREFDSYSSSISRTEDLIDFGSAVLTGGYNTIEFRTVGKNSNSTGYAFGIDTLKLTPAGGIREGENYTSLTHPDTSPGISAYSGDAVTNINMHDSPDGLWSADYYMNYGANAVNDFVLLNFYYDRWYVTTFLDGVSDNLDIEFSNMDGKGGTSGDLEWLARLEGNTTTWDAISQTQAAAPATRLFVNGADGIDEKITFRNLIMANYTLANGMMLSVKFCAGDSNPLTINSAYVIQRDDSETAQPDNGSTNMPSIPITFNNCDLDPRNLGQAGGVPTGSGNTATIPAGCYAWSNWVQLYDNGSTPFNFDKTQDYFVSFYIGDIGAGNTESISYWQDTASSPKIHSYTWTPDYAATQQWSGNGTAQTATYGVEEIAVTYVDAGVFNSQVFDTAVDDPAYSTLKWTAVINNPDSALQIKVRSSDSEAALGADADWTSITGQTFTINSGAGTAALSTGTGRYVQFRAEFSALPSGTDSSHITNDTDDTYAGDEDYDITCVLKDVSIYWPGNTTMVDVGGHFTKKSDYGIFAVRINGEQLTKGFEVKLSMSEGLTRAGETVTRSITAEVEPRNTNK